MEAESEQIPDSYDALNLDDNHDLRLERTADECVEGGERNESDGKGGRELEKERKGSKRRARAMEGRKEWRKLRREEDKGKGGKKIIEMEG